MGFAISGFLKEIERLRRKRTVEGFEPEPAPEEPSERRKDQRAADDSPVLLEWIGEDEELRLEMAHTYDRSESGVGVECAQPLASGLPVLVTRRGELGVKAVVCDCRAHQSAWRIGLRLIHEERRRADRQPFPNAKVELRWEDADGASHEGDVEIVNASETGVQLRMPKPVAIDSTVRVADENWQRFGAVVYSRLRSGSYLTGVHFSGPPRLRRMFEYKE